MLYVSIVHSMKHTEVVHSSLQHAVVWQNFIMYVKGSAENSFTKDNNLISSVILITVQLV